MSEPTWERRFPRGLCLLLALACSFTVCPRAAADPQTAKEHFERALAHVDRQEYRKAVAAFRRAYEEEPHYSVLFNLGQAHVLLDEPAEAIIALERYLEDGDTDIPPERVEEVRQTLREQRKLVGELVVQSHPDDASIVVDGRPVGTTPLSEPLVLRTGRHLVRATRSGYDTAEQWVDVIDGRAGVVDLALVQKTPPPHPTAVSAQLAVRCAIPGVAVQLDRRVLGRTPLPTALLVEPGKHRVSFDRPGYAFASPSVELSQGGVAQVACDGTVTDPVPPDLAATLTVRATPTDGSEVRIDGSPRGSSAELPAGPHLVEVRRFGHEIWSQQIHLSAGQILEVHAELTPTAGYLAEHRSRSLTQRIVAYVVGGAGLALAGVAVGHFAWNQGRHDDWSDENDALEPQWTGQLPRAADLEQRQAANDELLRSVLRADAVTTGLGVGAGALLVTGIILFATGEDPGQFEVVPQAGAAAGGLGVRGRW